MTPEEVHSSTMLNGGVWFVPSEHHAAAKRAVQQGLVVGGAITLNPWHVQEAQAKQRLVKVTQQYSWQNEPVVLNDWVDEDHYEDWITVWCEEAEHVLSYERTERTRTRTGSAGPSVDGGGLVVVAVSQSLFNEWITP